jgi:hypothetical protein
MSVLRRTRGVLLRLVRDRRASIAVGLLMTVTAASARFSGRFGAWWIEGLSLIIGATGLALLWTGLTGPSPDWIDRS